MPLQVPQCFGPRLLDACRTHVRDEGNSECRRRQRCFCQVEELCAELEQLDRGFCVREIAIIVLAYDQGVSGDALGSRESESGLPVPQAPLFIDLC